MAKTRRPLQLCYQPRRPLFDGREPLTVPERRRLIAKYALEQAELGNPWVLIGRVANLVDHIDRLGALITAQEVRFLVANLAASQGKAGRNFLRTVREGRMAMRADTLATEGKQRKSARRVAGEFACSERTVFKAIKAIRTHHGTILL